MTVWANSCMESNNVSFPHHLFHLSLNNKRSEFFIICSKNCINIKKKLGQTITLSLGSVIRALISNIGLTYTLGFVMLTSVLFT